MDKHLHIVTHDVPFPVAHGGLVDLYHKIVSLHANGVKIHLHCFKKSGQSPQPHLNKFCVSVNYYLRTTGIRGVSFSKPYIVSSRNSRELVNNLSNDEHPILLGGVHCTALLGEKILGKRKFLIRLYNVEYKYYSQLARFERNTFKKIYYYAESSVLTKYESSIATKATIVALSDADARFYREQLHADAHFLPVFIPHQQVKYQPETGMYCLYQANLSVNENEEVVRWLLDNVFAGLPIPLVIAGRNPSPQLVSFVESKPDTCLVQNPTEEEMQDMIEKAQINILPSFNNTGVKLKLLNALFNGKHCLVNKAGVEGSGVEELCSLAENSADFKHQIKRLFDREITIEEIKKRELILQKIYNNDANAKMLMTLIW